MITFETTGFEIQAIDMEQGEVGLAPISESEEVVVMRLSGDRVVRIDNGELTYLKSSTHWLVKQTGVVFDFGMEKR